MFGGYDSLEPMTVTIGIILASFLALILLSKKTKSFPDKILLAWLTVIAITLVLFKLQTPELRSGFPLLLGWVFPFPLLQWPFLYLYVVSLTSPKPFSRALLLHFVPFVFGVLLFSNYYFLPYHTKLHIYNQQGQGYETEMTINLLAILLSAVVYTILASRELWRYKQNIKNEFSDTEKITLNWLFYLVVSMTCILLIVVFGAHDDIVFSSITGVVTYIGYFGIKQVGVFSEKLKTEQTWLPKEKSEMEAQVALSTTSAIEHGLGSELPNKTERVKYEKTKISSTETESIHQRLKELMNNEKLYKNPELTLSEVARRIPVHPNALSQVINSVEGKNFYDYINFKRVEEFQQAVAAPKNNQYTLLSLAFECGFNSKTSFNRNFKKVTKLSPSEFLKQKNIQIQN